MTIPAMLTCQCGERFMSGPLRSDMRPRCPECRRSAAASAPVPCPRLSNPVLSVREQFLALLLTGPLLRSDAIVVLCGEDATPRANVGLQLLQQNAAPTLVLTGGLHTPPSRLGAAHLRSSLIGKGVSPDRILVDDDSLNTHDQAVHVVRLALDSGWRRLLLVASSYHMGRAFLTFVQALRDAEAEDTVRVVPVPASQSAWYASPDGLSRTRMELLAVEAEKVERYTEHVATYEQGIAYLEAWEGR